MRTVARISFTSVQHLFDSKGAAVLDDGGKHVVGPVTKIAYRGTYEMALADAERWKRDSPEADIMVDEVQVDETESGTMNMKTMRSLRGGRKTTITLETV